MRNHPSGFQTDWSSRLPRKKQRRRRRQRLLRNLTRRLEKVKVNSPIANKITWMQIKTLTQQAKQLLLSQGKSLTPCMYFIAFLTLISSPKVESTAYWAYVPNPPLLHPVGWFDQESIKILTNDTLRLGGFQDSESRGHASSFVNFTGRADSLPICLTLKGRAPPFCLQTSFRVFLTDAPDPNDPAAYFTRGVPDCHSCADLSTFLVPSPCFPSDWSPPTGWSAAQTSLCNEKATAILVYLDGNTPVTVTQTQHQP
ncbi:endogenous retrovirus group K member 19 Env polyprotein-like [Nycticebus coucang]|uniref:endogenous retrovirus group K member 19 Env polyprotein-like n=1 Tax=Nycticebus coucang TaxID=9470 RepID=UPI00234DD527|nr:endogenous retrovirus group K member 19 Env polyprotein-like [Nycticebus coucang]